MRHDVENLNAAHYIPNVPLTTFCSAECYIKKQFLYPHWHLKGNECHPVEIGFLFPSVCYNCCKTAPRLLLTFIFSVFQRYIAVPCFTQKCL